jgi:uncharacterized membrane protein
MTKGRLEAFSDAVFAIAITLLIVEVHVPEVEEGESLARALGDQWPQYAAYAISFMVIGIIWLNHHHVVTEVATVTRRLVLVNLALLGAVAFLPFPTALLADYLTVGGDRARVAAGVYTASMLVTSTCFFLLWRHIVRARLHDDELDAEGLRWRTRRAAVGPVVYTALLPVALVSAPLVLALHAGVGLFYAMDAAAADPPSP